MLVYSVAVIAFKRAFGCYLQKLSSLPSVWLWDFLLASIFWSIKMLHLDSIIFMLLFHFIYTNSIQMNYSFKSLDYLLLTFLILPHYPVLLSSVSALCQYLFETNCPILLIVLLSVSVMGSDIAIRHHVWLSTLYQPVGCMPSKLLRIYFKTKQNCCRLQLLSCGMLSVSKICFLLCIISYWLYCLQICCSNILWVKVWTKILKSNTIWIGLS